MRPTVFQRAELRDENDNIVQQGTYGKGSALSNSTNDGWIDYVMNNLEALYGIAKDEVVPVSALPASGDMNKTYLLTTNGKTYRWSGTAWVEISSSEAVGRAETAANLAEQWATKTDGVVADNEYSAKYYSNVSKDWANKLNATVDGSEYSAKHYAGVAEGWAEDAEDTAEDIADHLSQIDQNTGGVSANSKRIGNIEKLLQGNLYDYQTDSTSAYTKTVPSGAMPYAGLEQIGGKTVVWNQLNKNTAASGTRGDITTTNNGDGSWTFNGTTSSAFSITMYSTTVVVGHKLLFKGCPAGGGSSTYYFGLNGAGVDVGNGGIFTAAITTLNIRFDVKNAGIVFDNVTFYPQVFDLTLMFGAGNEPSTVEEFEAMFPASYYPYNAGTLLSAGVTEVVSKDSNNTTLQTYSIPASIQALEGYGWSAGSVYNYVDFERKVFVKRVGSYTINGNTTFSKAKALDDGSGYWVSLDLFFQKNFPQNPAFVNAVMDKRYIQNPYTTYWEDLTFGEWRTYNRDFVITVPPQCSTKELATAYFANNPATLYYELATPVEVDISAYLTDDNLINVESGGTLTFPNSNGDDYQISVPSEETYMIDLQASL